MPNLYAGREALKARLALTGNTDDDATFDSILEAVSRNIDDKVGHFFYVRNGVEYVTPVKSEHILIPDLLVLTTLKTDTSGDMSYATTWTANDYVLYPRNALAIQKPYWEIKRAPGGAYRFFPGVEVEIVGRWGYSETLLRSTATVNGAHNATTTTLAVSSGPAFAIGRTLRIGTEQLFVSDIADDSLTVQRAVNGTTAASILTGAVIDVYDYPPVVSEACLAQAQHHYHSSKSVGGVIGGGDMGAIRFGPLAPAVRGLLQPIWRKRMY